jgi:uncharacterized membrane protein required for colicin V production
MCAAWVVAVIAAPKLDLSACDLKSAPPPTWIVLIANFVVAGAVICALLRLIVGEIVGSDLSIPDRIAGLGAFRIVLLAVLLVLLFDRVIPSGREPAFLKESQRRPVLSSAAQYGLQSLPPEVDDHRSSEAPAPDLTAPRTFLLKSAKTERPPGLHAQVRPRSRFLMRCQASLRGRLAGAVIFASCIHL